MDTVKGIIDRELEKHPHHRALIEAFRPVFMARAGLFEHLKLGKTVPFTIDETRFRDGVPIAVQSSLFQSDDPWQEAVLTMVSAAKEGFPALTDDLSRFEDAVREGKIAVSDVFTADQAAGEPMLIAWAETFSIAPAAMSLVLQQAARVVLSIRGRAMAELLKDIPWEKGYCPICGTFPSMAIIGEKIGERRLHCSSCGHDWRFSRVICPYCEHEGQEGMNFFLIENKAQETAFTCDQCRRYLITLHRVSDINELDLDIVAMGLIHLDVIMQEKNFVPMAETYWNNLGISAEA